MSGAKKVADDLERVCAGLEPFGKLNVVQLSDFLIRAEEYARTGVVRTTASSQRAGSRTASTPIDPKALENAVSRLRDLQSRVTSPDVSYGEIDKEIRQLGKNFKKPEVLEIAKQMGITASLKTKQAALVEMQRLLTETKESYERTRF